MKLLVYGAGVIGCELAHVLKTGGNDVTLLARGDWKDTLERRGLVIRHYLQRVTTTDKVKVTGCLNPGDEYDIIFVAMQADQVPDVLSAIAANVSRYVVFIGNNPWAEKTENPVQTGSPVEKEVAFGFMTAGGRRENGRVVSIHVRAHLTVGGRDGELSDGFREYIVRAFSDSGCSLAWESRMDAWLKCHMAEILPLGYVSYAVSCSLPKASKSQRRAMVDATAEGFSLLKALGYPIRPAEDEALFTGGIMRMLWRAAMFVMCKTPLGRLAVTDHCSHAVSEMSFLDRAWEELRAEAADASANISMPVWDNLRNSAGSSLEKNMSSERKEGRHEQIRNAYKSLGGEATFYDGMITCSTLPGKLICRLVWNMDKKKNDHYLQLALSGIPEGFAGRMLEVPVGTGILSMPVYETLGSADITCMDYSADMMERAKRQAEKRGLKNVRFLQGDVGKLPFKDDSFDLVLSLNGFHAFPDKEAAYREIFRVLKLGGIFCGCFYVKGRNKRTDWFIDKLYTPKGFFTPPYETVESLRMRLKSMYRKAEVKSVEGMAVFRCRKGKA
ncbi:MAG: methyltransferase domain-containing protein [Clostridium sp.]|nr:methyltransferase domain-containing protein [Acetatifactor muris]MCM1526269.1 methyltransferase domain-containing protein [Bacteroides sp.]MCM1562914.1 methyltransferase domain-containing protein [Clostridium sp.]